MSRPQQTQDCVELAIDVCGEHAEVFLELVMIRFEGGKGGLLLLLS